MSVLALSVGCLLAGIMDACGFDSTETVAQIETATEFTVESKYEGKIININEVNVQPTPSSAGQPTSQLKYGTSQAIYEATITENNIFYTDVNCTGAAGAYAAMSVVEKYDIVGEIARTKFGWVCTNDLL